MSCQVRIQQLKEAVAWANEELKNGEFFCIFDSIWSHGLMLWVNLMG